MDLESQIAVAGAAASMSMADVDMTQVGQKKKSKGGMMAYLTYVFCLATSSLAVVNIALFGSAIVDVAMGFGIVVSVLAAYQRRILHTNDTLVDVMNELRSDVNRLGEENNDLSMRNDQLATKVDRLKGSEESLEKIVGTQNINTSRFVKSVKENQKILDEMQKLISGQVLHSIVNMVLKCDKDGDFQIDAEEVNELVLRMRMISGVKSIDEEKVRGYFAGGGKSVKAILNVGKAIMANPEENEYVQVSSRNLKA